MTALFSETEESTPVTESVQQRYGESVLSGAAPGARLQGQTDNLRIVSHFTAAFEISRCCRPDWELDPLPRCRLRAVCKQERVLAVRESCGRAASVCDLARKLEIIRART